MKPIDCPFKTADGELSLLGDGANIVFVDIHAETTSEKQALGYYLDGRVSAVVGTHTHIQTADECILPKGTAYITDAGMTGPFDSIIGMKHDAAIKRFLTGMPYKFSVATGDIRMQGVIVEVDDQTGKAISIERYTLKVPDNGTPFDSGDDTA
jgi:metallophosphoesterase (TIGR00282 family)